MIVGTAGRVDGTPQSRAVRTVTFHRCHVGQTLPLAVGFTRAGAAWAFVITSSHGSKRGVPNFAREWCGGGQFVSGGLLQVSLAVTVEYTAVGASGQ